MNEETQATPEVEASTAADDWSNITLDDVASEETAEDKPETEETAPEQSEADQLEEKEGEEADTPEAEPEAEKQTDQFVLKHLDEERTVSRDEVVTLAQKGMDYDRVKQQLTEERDKGVERERTLTALAKESGFKNADEMLDDVRATMLAQKENIDKGVAIERVKLERREAEIAKREEAIKAERESKDSEAAKTAEVEKKRQDDILSFAKAYPDVKPESIPKEVWKEVTKGETLLNAYIKYENAQLKAQIAAKEKAAENKARSTGSRQSAGSAAEVDEFTAAWNEA